KGFVPAIAIERDRDPPPRHLGDVIGRDRRRIGKRFAVMPDQLWQYRDRIGLDDKFLVLGAIALSDAARVTPLVVILVGAADRKRLDPAVTGARHHRDDAARIDAARQK